MEIKRSVIDYLAALVWDGVSRLDRWLVDYAGAENTAYVRAVSRLMLIAAVRRARKPGCRFDQLPVLVGPQGSGKSSALRVLAVEDSWIANDLPRWSDTRRFMESTEGRWIVEADELKGMGLTDVAAFKACLSRTHDEARLPYARKVTRVPRQFVIIGTMYDAEDYLHAPTSNRRFWPVRVKHFDLERLRNARDQLWAEAAEAEVLCKSLQIDPKVFEDVAIEQEAPLSNAQGRGTNTDKVAARCTQIADAVVPEYRGGEKSYSCTGVVAKRWQAAWDGACTALGIDPESIGQASKES